MEASGISSRAKQADLPQAVMKKGFHGATTAQAQQSRKRCVTCDSPDCSSLFKCEAFKKLTPESRFEIARNNHLCYSCLKGGHGSADCKADSTCAAKGCRIKHTKFLHVTRGQRAESESRVDSQLPAGSKQAAGRGPSAVCCHIMVYLSPHNTASR